MLPAATFLDLCHARGVSFISGTPCSYLKPLINAAIDDARFVFRDAVNEGDAVAMAAGAVLAGRRALVMFQNSGLGNAVNALTSLCHPFRVPVLLVVTHRGEPGGEPDEPQHAQMGRITTALLDTMEIPWARFPDEAAAAPAALDRALAGLAEGRPFAFVMSKDAVAPHALRRRPPADAPGERRISFREELQRAPAERMTRTDALRAMVAARDPREVLIATTGYTGRELYALGDEPWNLYVVGSMGSASALGLGLALHTPRRVTVIEGDGAVLMRLGNLATLGAYAPPQLLHVVLDNESHDSTGGQATVSRGVALAAVAQACGYRRVGSIDEPAALVAALAGARKDGPAFLHVRIRPGAPEKLPRPKVTPAEVFARLQRWLAAG
ncbi:MAG: phosphonopyruvate decarboxylase [Verrucomicrobia bacterium]|nr:phosphonopyruvate decarboxylase [Verrucomicrobiota bacterium]